MITQLFPIINAVDVARSVASLEFLYSTVLAGAALYVVAAMIGAYSRLR